MKLKNKAIFAAAMLAGCNTASGQLMELPPAQSAPDGIIGADLYRADGDLDAMGEGPQGSSRLRPGEERYDRVGYAGYAGDGPGVYALSAVLPQGSFAEVTALDTGRTILIQIRASGSGLIELSGDAARQLGVNGTPAVRVRRTAVTPQDRLELSAGRAVPVRADAPPALLVGLRRKLDDESRVVAAKPAPSRPAPVAPPPTKPAPTASKPAPKPAPRPAPVASAGKGLFVQIAALSNAERARALAAEVGGIVRPGGTIYRVQIGPYADRAQAERARSNVARRGFSDARIITLP